MQSERRLSVWEVRNRGSKLEEYYAALRRLLPVIQRSIEAIVYVSVATLLVHRFGQGAARDRRSARGCPRPCRGR
jgi:hypothetical protein